MKHKLAFTLTAVVLNLLVMGASAISVQAQNDASPLATQLKEHYKISKPAMDANGWSIVQPGTVLTVLKGGILGVPAANLTMATATYKDGEMHPPGGGSLLFVGKDTKQIPANEKVYILKIDVNLKNDKVSFTVIECDACNNVQQPSFYKGVVAFQFPKGYLATADVGQVEDVVSQVLAEDTNSEQAQQGAPGQSAAPQEPPAQAAPPVTVDVGQTPDQVKAAMGQPEKILTVGKKQIYVYKDLKITFIDGKVADVQ